MNRQAGIVVLVAFQLLCASPLVAQGLPTKDPLVVGVVDKLQSRFLEEARTINIFLPAGYTMADPATTYPVIYVLDGGVDEDFIHVAGLIRFNSQPWIARLPQSIVVGIENTSRQRDFTFAVSDLEFLEKAGYSKEDMKSYGGSAKYIEFLESELQPYIESTYRGSGERTVIGESLAGLLATEILLKHRHLFDTYIIITPSLWWGGESLLNDANELVTTVSEKPIKLYIGAAQKEEAPQMYRSAKALHQALSKTQHFDAHFDYLSDERHSTIMHQAVYNALKKLYPKTAISP